MKDKKRRKRLLAIIIPLGLVIVLVSGGLIFLSQSYDPMPEALDALETSGGIIVNNERYWIGFHPSNASTEVGFIFYPGGNVDPESYSIIARGIALNGYMTFIVKMPFDLAIFSPYRAWRVIETFTNVSSWVIGGHSLGGSMASRYIYSEPSLFSGLILLASYPADNNNLSTYSLPALTIYGSLDGVLTKDIPDTLSLLPAGTIVIEIVGGNHANFGSYGDQKGDNPASINRFEQQNQTIFQISQFLSGLP
jgi:hypothetical protein